MAYFSNFIQKGNFIGIVKDLVIHRSGAVYIFSSVFTFVAKKIFLSINSLCRSIGVDQ